MKYFLCFAVLLAGFIISSDSKPSGEGKCNVEGLQPNIAQRYSVTVGTRKFGPLCSGAFISEKIVVTTATCGLRRSLKDLMVYYYAWDGCHYAYVSAKVTGVRNHPLYKLGGDMYNIGGLEVDVQHNVPEQLELLTPEAEGEVLKKKHELYIPRYSAVDLENGLYMQDKYDIKTDYHMTRCGENFQSRKLLICVYREDDVEFTIPFVEAGTPLIISEGNRTYFYGLDGNNWPDRRKSFIYQAARGNYDYLLDLVDA